MRLSLVLGATGLLTAIAAALRAAFSADGLGASGVGERAERSAGDIRAW